MLHRTCLCGYTRYCIHNRPCRRSLACLVYWCFQGMKRRWSRQCFAGRNRAGIVRRWSIQCIAGRNRAGIVRRWSIQCVARRNRHHMPGMSVYLTSCSCTCPLGTRHTNMDAPQPLHNRIRRCTSMTWRCRHWFPKCCQEGSHNFRQTLEGFRRIYSDLALNQKGSFYTDKTHH